MEVKKSNKGLIITIIILIILLLGSAGYICYDKFLTKEESKQTPPKTEETKEELVPQNEFKPEDIKCKGTDTCEKTIKLAYNGKNHELKLIKKYDSSNKNYLIEVYEDNALIDTIDGGHYEDYWGDGTKPVDNIKNMDGYVYVIDSKYIGLVYTKEGPKSSWYLKFYNGNTPSSEDPINVASYGTSISSESYEYGKSLFVLSALEFDGHSIKYWYRYCNKNIKPTNSDNTVVAQYSLNYDGKKVTKTTGKILTDAVTGGEGFECDE